MVALLDIIECGLITQVFRTFSGSERYWAIKTNKFEPGWTKWFRAFTVENLIREIEKIDRKVELNFSTALYDKNDNKRGWTFIIDLDGEGRKDDLKKLTEFFDKLDIVYLVDNRFHIWFPDWETVLVKDWLSYHSNSYFASNLKTYLEMVFRLKGVIDDNVWKNHLIRAPYSYCLDTGKRQRFTVSLKDALKLWDGKELDKRKKNTLYYAERFKKFIEEALKQGEELNIMMRMEFKRLPNWVHGEIRPCLRKLPADADHNHRLAFLWEYMNKTDMTDEQLVEMFKHVNDFNRRKTMYYIKHSRRKGYKPFSCQRLFEMGICLKEKCDRFKRLMSRIEQKIKPRSS